MCEMLCLVKDNEMKMLKKCPLCGELIDPENGILCTNCGNMLTEESSYEGEEEQGNNREHDPENGALEESANTHVLPDGTILNGRYQIKRYLGQGGFGITYEGIDTLLGARIAVKEYYPKSLAERHTSISLNVTITLKEDIPNYKTGLDCFLQEARNLAQFAGEECIVHVSDYFRANNTAYIVMEYVDGITVAEYVKQKGRVPFAQCMEYMVPVMKALEIVHDRKMVHRDISPSNIMIRKNGGIKLLDFGAARIVDSVSRSMSVIIRPGYTPIEQYSEKRPQGPYTDIFALCGTFYYMLTGRVPENLYDRMMKRAELIRPSELGADISPEQELAVLKGLEINPEDRFQTIEELREALLKTKSTPEKEDGPAEVLTAPFHYIRILLVSVDILLIIGIILLIFRKLTG